VRRRWLGTLLLAPLLLGGCGSSGGTASAVPDPSGSPWVLVANGKAAASATPKAYSGTPSTYPTGFLPLSSASPTARPTPSANCTPPGGAMVLNAASVVPGNTSAAVTFYNRGGSDLVEFRVTAISQDLQTGAQRDVGWTVITPGVTCGFMTATVTGLDRKTYYVFSVDAVTTHHDHDGTMAKTVARSRPISTT
jgi:hypothetical protein